MRGELDRILASHEFRSSRRCQEFLRYIVEAALGGRAEQLKERTIGIEVFGRAVSYDPSDDATVRVKAGEVRRRLGTYYAGEGAKAGLRIELPSGTYIPEFRIGKAAEQAAAPKRRLSRWPLALVAAGALAAAPLLWNRLGSSGSPLDRFWAPVLKSDAPVSLCASYVPVYGLTLEAESRAGAKRPEDFVLLPDQFVGGGDLTAVARIASMLTRRRRPYRIRVGNEMTFDDLRAAPAILVGYSYTRWREISSQMRFFIDAARRPRGITDNGRPTKWALPDLPADRHTSQDYALVSRVFLPDTRAMLVEVAGITQYGTEAAADLVTDSDLFAEALRGLEAGWEKKNLQLVLHLKVISGQPTAPRVVAAHLW